MIRINNLIIKDGIVEFDYCVEDDPNEVGHAIYDIHNYKLISNRRNPLDEKDNCDYYAKRSIQFVLTMIESGETDRLFCYY